MSNLHFKTTADGSSTLYNPLLDEHYHSIHGALQESLHVFIKMGFVNFSNTFKTAKRAARTGRNPQTGAELKIPARTVPSFKAGAALKSAVN